MSKIWILTSAPEPLSERLRELGHDPRPADWETIRSHSPVEADLILAELPEQGDLPTLALPYPPVLLLAPPPASADRALEQVGNVAFDVLPPLSEPKSFARQLERGLQYAKLLRENHS